MIGTAKKKRKPLILRGVDRAFKLSLLRLIKMAIIVSGVPFSQTQRTANVKLKDKNHRPYQKKAKCVCLNPQLTATSTYNPFEVVELPFPFSDLSATKKRKALVISSKVFNEKSEAVTVIMITSKANSDWPGDVEIIDWEKAGLRKPCYIRLKFFTADKSMFLGKVGTLSSKDKNNLRESFKKYMPI